VNTIFDVLNARSEWESIVDGFTLPQERKQGTLSNLQYFVDEGIKKNRFREGADQATDLANQIIVYHNNHIITRIRS